MSEGTFDALKHIVKLINILLNRKYRLQKLIKVISPKMDREDSTKKSTHSKCLKLHGKLWNFLIAKKYFYLENKFKKKQIIWTFSKKKKSFQSKSQNHSFRNESQNPVNIIFVNCNILLNSTSSQMTWCEKCHLKKIIIEKQLNIWLTWWIFGTCLYIVRIGSHDALGWR